MDWYPASYLDQSGGGFAFSGMVLAWNGAHGDGDTVPSVDGGDGIGQIDQFVFREFLADGFVEFIGNVILRDQRERFGPFQSGAFARREKGSFAPGIERIESLLGVAGGASVD